MSHQGNHNIIESQQERILQLEAELEICREALKELIGGEWETVMIGTAYRRRTLTYTFEQVEKLYNLISSPPSELGRKVMEVVEAARKTHEKMAHGMHCPDECVELGKALDNLQKGKL